MSGKTKTGLPGAFLRGMAAWVISAAALLLCASVLLASGAGDMSTMGYVSSLISFVSAVCAALCFKAAAGEGIIKSAVFCFILISLLLLTGFLISGSLDGSSVLSAASFTLAGGLLGALLPRKNAGKRTKPSLSKGFHKRRT